MAKAKKTTVRKLIDLPIQSARVLRDIAESKGMNSKNYIEFLCNTEVERHEKKQLNLFTKNAGKK